MTFHWFGIQKRDQSKQWERMEISRILVRWHVAQIRVLYIMILIIFYYLDVLLSDVESNYCEASTAEKCSSVVVQRPQLTNSIVNCFSSGGVSLSRYSKQLIEKGKSGNQKQLTPSNSEQVTTMRKNGNQLTSSKFTCKNTYTYTWYSHRFL